MKTFKVHRTEDVSGVSGTGIVAEGVLFPSGMCVVEWRGNDASIDINQNGVESWLRIHGHNGKTTVVFDGEQSLCSEICNCLICMRKRNQK